MLRPLTTTVIGSWSVPDWLERAKTAAYHGGVSRTQLSDMHDMAIKAVLKDQEVAGIDVVTDGELRRDNDVDHLLARVPGVVAREPVKAFYFDYLDLELQDRIPAVGPGPLGLAADLAFTRTYTDRPVRFSMTGPFSLSRRLRTGDGAGYGDSAGRPLCSTSPGCSTPRPTLWRRRAPSCCSSTSRSSRATRSTWSWPSRP